MDVDAEDLQPPSQPLHVLNQLEVAGVGAYLLCRPVGEGMSARAHQLHPTGVGLGSDLGDRGGEVAAGVVDGGANPGEDLHRRLHELVFGLGMDAARGSLADRGQHLGRPGTKLARLPIGDLQLHLDPQRGPR
jgi:hypothetical protein